MVVVTLVVAILRVVRGRAVGETTGQSEAHLRDDGVGGVLGEYLAAVPSQGVCEVEGWWG